jgi:signal transduction histidine kinase
MPDAWRQYGKMVQEGLSKGRWPQMPSELRVRDDELRDLDLDDDIDESLLTSEQREYLEARRFADKKAKFYGDAGVKGFIVLVLLVIVPPLGLIFGLIWGAKFGRRFFRYFVEPKLRDRFLDEEVGVQVRSGIEEDRRDLEHQHSRSLEKLSASIAHEIRNPITAAKSLVQQMGEDPRGTDNPEYAQVALAELERVERSISHLLRFARDEDLKFSELRMIDVLDSALETFRDRAVRTGVEIRREFDCEGALRGDAEKLRRVVINLVGNAFDALDESHAPLPVIDVAMGENLAGSEVWLRVRDNGAGMDSATRDKALNPFVTSKPSGTGLGLAIVKKIVDLHDGSIELESSERGGTEFILTFPKKPRSTGGAS